jgi:putative Holliday junction resolvase
MASPEIILGLDLGDRHIGVAIGNSITRTATPLADLPNDRSLAHKLSQLQTEYGFEKIIVGLPVTATGKRGEQVGKVLTLVNSLSHELAVEIILEDERFTTQAAAKFLAENPSIHATIDGASAKLILEGWLVRQ